MTDEGKWRNRRNPEEAGKSMNKRRPKRDVSGRCLVRMVNSERYCRPGSKKTASRGSEVDVSRRATTRPKPQKKTMNREVVVARVLGGVSGFEYWSAGKRTQENLQAIESVFSHYGLSVPDEDPSYLADDLIDDLCRDLTSYGFITNTRSIVTVKACAALYWHIKLS